MSENIGEYNRFVTISTRNTARDGLNQPLDGLVPLFSCWAKVRGQSGMGVIKTGNVDVAVDRNSWRLLGFRPNVTTAMVLVYNGELHDIKAVRLDRANKEYTDLVCEASGAVGD
jgi:SPP1 family predicted phage head-tail adaptor